jgi:Bacteriophage related domain of unknown function
MSDITFQQAIDDMQKIVLDAWFPTGFQIFWEAIEDDRKPDDNAWLISTIRHVGGRQETLGGIGNRSFLRTGIIFLQIFTRVGKGLQESYQLAKVLADAFEGQSSPKGVWFRNVRINEVGKDGTFSQTNVTVEFQYNEVK